MASQQEKRRKQKGRKTSGNFAMFPRHILESAEYAKLKPWDVKLLLDLFGQSNGSNNGDFTAAWTEMKKRGWGSKRQLSKAKKNLLDAGFIMETRKGSWIGPHNKRCSLYAVSWVAIDECRDSKTGKHKLDVSPTRVASNAWKKPAQHFETPKPLKKTPKKTPSWTPPWKTETPANTKCPKEHQTILNPPERATHLGET